MSRFLFMFVVLNLSCEMSVARSAVRYETLVEVPFGESVTLACESNDANHTFFFWLLSERNIVIGPGDEFKDSYNSGKFRYEVLSGNLTVKTVSKAEEGIYICFSRGIKKDDVNARSVRMVLQNSQVEVTEPANGNAVTITAIVLTSLTLTSGIIYAIYRLWKSRSRYSSYLGQDEDDSGDESGDELFRTPGTSQSTSIIKTQSTDSFETPGISTDFSSILDARGSK